MLRQISITGGVADLGRWGAIKLTGATSAVVSAAYAPNIELPIAVAEELPDSALLLNVEGGRLLVLPYAGETVATITLTDVDDPSAVISIPRHVDSGMRLADLEIMRDGGVLFLTERSLLLFEPNLSLAWQVEDEFLGWEVGSVSHGRIELVSSDWSGSTSRQSRDLADGRRIR